MLCELPPKCTVCHETWTPTELNYNVPATEQICPTCRIALNHEAHLAGLKDQAMQRAGKLYNTHIQKLTREQREGIIHREMSDFPPEEVAVYTNVLHETYNRLWKQQCVRRR